MSEILIIDDDVDICTEMKEILASKCHIAESVNNASDGIKMALSGKYKLILLDLKMPGINGRTALREIKSKMPELKIMVLTGSQVEPSLLEGEVFKPDEIPELFQNSNQRELILADMIINKPFDIDMVLKNIDELLK